MLTDDADHPWHTLLHQTVVLQKDAEHREEALTRVEDIVAAFQFVECLLDVFFS